MKTIKTDYGLNDWKKAPGHDISESGPTSAGLDPVNYRGISIYTRNLKECMLGLLTAIFRKEKIMAPLGTENERNVRPSETA